ncbi:hypothetical protein PG990_004261 [Apiospora arundinis]
MATSSFPNFARLPDEIKVMIWKEAAKAEAASRIVILHTSNIEMLPSSENTPSLSVMPLKRLISPLLMVCVQSRQVALRHYGTRVNVYERPSPMDWARPGAQPIGLWSMSCREFSEHHFMAGRDRSMTEEAPSSVQSRFFHPLRVTEPVWADQECVTDGIDCWLEKGINREMTRRPVDSRTVDDEKNYEEYEADAAIQNMQTYRGCVYLNLASDRFMLLMSPNYCYGLREVSNALDDFKYGTSSASFHGIYETIREIVAHRPPVLRHTSAPLSDEVLMGIRHVVLPEISLPYPIVCSYMWTRVGHCLRNPWAICPDPELEEDGLDIAASNHPGTQFVASHLFDSFEWAMTLPGAFGATPSSTTWGFNTSPEMNRAFFDDIEDKGPEHLRLQKVRKESNGPGPEDWNLVWD